MQVGSVKAMDTYIGLDKDSENVYDDVDTYEEMASCGEEEPSPVYCFQKVFRMSIPASFEEQKLFGSKFKAHNSEHQVYPDTACDYELIDYANFDKSMDTETKQTPQTEQYLLRGLVPVQAPNKKPIYSCIKKNLEGISKSAGAEAEVLPLQRILKFRVRKNKDRRDIADEYEIVVATQQSGIMTKEKVGEKTGQPVLATVLAGNRCNSLPGNITRMDALGVKVQSTKKDGNDLTTKNDPTLLYAGNVSSCKEEPIRINANVNSKNKKDPLPIYAEIKSKRKKDLNLRLRQFHSDSLTEVNKDLHELQEKNRLRKLSLDSGNCVTWYFDTITATLSKPDPEVLKYCKPENSRRSSKSPLAARAVLTADMLKALPPNKYVTNCGNEPYRCVTDRWTDADDGGAFEKESIVPNVLNMGSNVYTSVHKSNRQIIQGKQLPIRPKKVYTRDAWVSVESNQLTKNKNINSYVKLSDYIYDNQVELGIVFLLQERPLVLQSNLKEIPEVNVRASIPSIEWQKIFQI